MSSADPTGDPVPRPDDFDLAESWREIADEVERRRTPLEIQATCTPDGIARLRMVLGDRLEVGGATTDGRIEVVIRAYNEYALAGELDDRPTGCASPPGLDRQRARRTVRLRPAGEQGGVAGGGW
ncbi:hypothetical protein KZZ52_44625 [Dactylosporangium sp. AC04546]|uniref:hypothetical protein n=1 Tax=Dactylosporangium sp. AC04546 TaxID=2862460 RepID=UPI001EE0C7AD|nr:hypothetical protein [Dactylosporangium sp. AC04546]WVK81002.1 hypothetical protein KZZ52_44625 [Dactylosporangium sp. AC04546]